MMGKVRGSWFALLVNLEELTDVFFHLCQGQSQNAQVGDRNVGKEILGVWITKQTGLYFGYPRTNHYAAVWRQLPL